jgi:hypothetical protein
LNGGRKGSIASKSIDNWVLLDLNKSSMANRFEFKSRQGSIHSHYCFRTVKCESSIIPIECAGRIPNSIATDRGNKRKTKGREKQKKTKQRVVYRL